MPDIIEQVQMLDIIKALRLGFPDKSNDWLAYQWQRAINNTDINADHIYLPALADHDMPADKAIASAILEHVFGIDLDGNTVVENCVVCTSPCEHEAGICGTCWKNLCPYPEIECETCQELDEDGD